MSIIEHHIRISKRARYYTIGERAGASDVWIVCHGYGQLAGRFIRNFLVLEAPGRVIAAPEGLHRFYMDPPPMPAHERRVGASWMTREDRENDIADYVDYLDTLVGEFMAPTPHARLRVLGFSQGSATVLRWVARTTRVPDQLIIWAGEVPGDVDWRAVARKLGGTRIDVVRGDRDEAVPEMGLERNLAALTEVEITYQLHSFSGGHQLDDETLRRLASL